MTNHSVIRNMLVRMRELREEAGITPQEMDDLLLLGPGWTSRFESGEVVPSVDILLSFLATLEISTVDFFQSLPDENLITISRQLNAYQDENDIVIRFRYNEYDAHYRLANATISQFQSVLEELQQGLARIDNDNNSAILTDSIARTFLRASSQWPHANPSDLWWFLVYRAYCDPYNHPASNARRDFLQSWKRAAGWALEEVVVRHYGPFLQPRGVRLLIPDRQTKRNLLNQLTVGQRLEADKVDIVLTGLQGDREVCFGVVHVKASFAERRTDDVPMSQDLVNAGYTSPLWTMDCKSIPSEAPVNRGELGEAFNNEQDRRSAKRKDIEVDGYFSACFSYNSNTIPTPPEQEARARIYVCSFNNPDDAFSEFIITEWARFNR